MKNNNRSRRDFLKLLASGSAAGALGSVGQLTMMNQAVAASSGFSDYKALVCVYMYGGNDSFNMLIPSDATHADYQAIRAALAVQKNDLGLSSFSSSLSDGTLGTGSANPYNVDLTQEKAYTKGFYDLSAKGINLGVNGVMPEFAQLITENKLSIIANSGNLVAPTSRSQIQNKSANLPLFLFAHNHQQRELQTGQANKLNDIGWAGKIADAWQGINNDFGLGLNISYSGSDRMLIGNQTSPMVLNSGGVPQFREMQNNTGSSYREVRRTLFKDLIETGKSSNPFQQLEAGLLGRAMNNFDLLSNAWGDTDISYTKTGPYGEDLFDIPTTEMTGFQDKLNKNFIAKMKSIAKMIELGATDAFNTGSYNRQIFFVGLGSFDTHAAQATNHPILLRELSLGLWKFQKAMEELGHADKVTTFSMSDFGRTLTINSGLGTDHAWGSHHFVMGGAGSKASGTFNGGQLLGTLPELIPNGVDDIGDKGRMIPTIAQDQINATVCNWFGVDQSLISSIFPNLSNFETVSGNANSAYLNSLFV